jgi:malate dehydrogenase
MREVAIVGAGELGGAVAHVLARRDAVRSIVLADESGRVAAGKALDIAQAAPVEGFATQVTGTADLTTVAGSSVIVVAERVAQGPWSTDEGLLLLKRLLQTAPRAVFLCAGPSSRELVERGVRELRIERRRLFGTAPEALAAGARALVALSANSSPRDVALSVLGVPPSHTVIPWQDATVGGFALTRRLDEPARRALAVRIARLWPPGSYALASAAAAIVEAMAGRSRRTACCFVVSDVGSGARSRAAALPVRVDAGGIAEIIQPTLSVVEQVALDNAMML